MIQLLFVFLEATDPEIIDKPSLMTAKKVFILSKVRSMISNIPGFSSRVGREWTRGAAWACMIIYYLLKALSNLWPGSILLVPRWRSRSSGSQRDRALLWVPYGAEPSVGADCGRVRHSGSGAPTGG